ncbi:MAG: alpha/beta hydrolase fold domain-containing protein [Planctomycetaceae bacterium]|nr:alpha/beta hydrolase fold domain-containing protein [Planctomycetaceae bacterium]
MVETMHVNWIPKVAVDLRVISKWSSATLFVSLFFGSFLAQVCGQSNSLIEHTPTKLQFRGIATEDRMFLSSPSKSDPARVVSILEGSRRIVLPTRSATIQPEVTPAPLSYDLQQDKVAPHLASIRAIGATLQTLPFNEFGRRKVFVETNMGAKWLLQGITKLDPSYVQVHGIDMEGDGLFEFPFDFRMSTASIPGDLLVKMLRNATEDLSNYDQREQIIEFLISAERYNEAIRELNQLQVDFPTLERERFDRLKTGLVTASTRLVVRELDRRWEAGQLQTVSNLLENIDPQNVSPETMVDVSDRIKNIQTSQRELEQLRESIKQTFATYTAANQLDEKIGAELAALEQEILTNLNLHNRDRFATFNLRTRDGNLGADSSMSFLISGWLMGAAESFDNVTVALTLMETRDLLLQYLNSIDQNERDEIIQRLREIEAGSARYLAAIARHLLPWKAAPAPQPNSQGFFRIRLAEVPGQPEYLVQLPPEYSPYKKYPCVVALCDIQSNPDFEVEWWDSRLSPQDGYRTGQASRNGYIVIAPDWRKPQEHEYGYDPHAAFVVMRSLRESLRMFSIDSDRVFLSGHGTGGEVAWDIGLAHPDMWAGVIPISALADRYISFYAENSKRNLPFYFVFGENHLPPNRGMVGKFDKREGIFQDMALSPHQNFIVVKYVGRRSEHFLEEIIHLFDWMQNRRRSFAATEFEVTTMRPWDNYFWWLELNDIPSNLVVLPQAWNVEQSRSSLSVSGEISLTSTGQTKFYANRGGDSIRFWVSPQWAKMEEEILFGWNKAAKSTKLLVSPSRTVILEDLRTRSDTQNPFWGWVNYHNGWTSSNDLP